jgi:acyl-CoA reductase-like NAD-dependent aldehyde dehydrogenase
MKDKLVAKAKTLISGDPKKRETFIGPMISEKEAARLDGWIQAAASAGATILCGGKRTGAMLQATLLENVPLDADLCVEEAFGPAAVLQKFSTWDEAIAMVNDSKFGLQAGIFTRDFYKVQQAWDEMDVGGVVVGDVPSYRVKDSGIGREGVKFAMEDMTEIRNLVIRTPPG